MKPDTSPDTTPDTGLKALKAWLGSQVTVTVPGWGIAAVAAGLLVLVLVALD